MCGSIGRGETGRRGNGRRPSICWSKGRCRRLCSHTRRPYSYCRHGIIYTAPTRIRTVLGTNISRLNIYFHAEGCTIFVFKNNSMIHETYCSCFIWDLSTNHTLPVRRRISGQIIKSKNGIQIIRVLYCRAKISSYVNFCIISVILPPRHTSAGKKAVKCTHKNNHQKCPKETNPLFHLSLALF